jgi:chorismate synthase
MMNVPAEIFAILLKGVLEKAAEKGKKLQVGEKWEKIREKFSAVWIADGSTLEQIRKNMKISKEEKSKLGGKIMMVVEAFTPHSAGKSRDKVVLLT